MSGPQSLQTHTVGGYLPAFVCGKGTTSQVVSWTNNLGRPIYVYRGYIWVGESGGAITDTSINLLNLTSGDVFVSTGWDHYAAPTGLKDNYLSFNASPGWFLVKAGDEIQLQIGVTAYSVNPYVSAGFLLYYQQ